MLTCSNVQLGLFLTSMGIMEGRDSSHIQGKFKDLYLPLISANWQVWPLAQLINFRYMPLPYRVPFQSTCGVFWTLYLSIANSRYVILRIRWRYPHLYLLCYPTGTRRDRTNMIPSSGHSSKSAQVLTPSQAHSSIQPNHLNVVALEAPLTCSSSNLLIIIPDGL